ncbi:peptidase dimerization domain-containing protein [Rhodococcus erythropolis CCM2595]|uniref:M20 family metallopeptidase n=1 Tax=Rhodococcus erythropolis TaxID=1833 RepID=UPI00038DD040|nr:M20 family metallopeptidase [Rhodococcus erythropolis]AGT94794.1 peptidase dimerization domain-containing protein [Rhodococcus erythropolis CCM2595]PBI88262.1 Carboxypeptidase G2 precursor [Rhodococcus erythropolis]SUE10846.1 peptidase dimerization domain-containing protein [Rhodococcus erythropolis]
MTPVLATFEQLSKQMLIDIGTLVRCESPSSDLEAVAASADAVALVGTALLGVEPERVIVDGCTHLRWRLGEGPRRVLLLGHHDTVWPLGSLKTHPWSVEDGVIRGPGSFDMKIGVVMALYAAAHVDRGAPITVLVTGDEETGSDTSRALIEQSCRDVAAVLVLEASADGGVLKTARKGISDYRVVVSGRASHAGLEPEAGINAALELAHQIIRIAAMGSTELGTTVVPTVVSGGTTTNTVPASAEVTVDSRAWSREEQQRVDREIRALRPVLPGARLVVTGGPNRPPLEREMSAELFAIAARVAAEAGLGRLGESHVGGGSDGNLTAGLGVPTLDGLGAVGGGAHADHEHALVEEIPVRTALVTMLVNRLTEPVPSDERVPKK